MFRHRRLLALLAALAVGGAPATGPAAAALPSPVTAAASPVTAAASPPVARETSTVRPAAAQARQHTVVHVVAAENFWGNVIAQIGGHLVSVTSLITNPNADPHQYVANPADASAIARSGVVVENGAGYDSFMSQLVAGSGARPRVVDVQHVLGIGGNDPNPHFWYDTPKLPVVARAFEQALAAADPAGRALFERNLSSFEASLRPLDGMLATIARRFHGTPVAYTERVPGYLLAAARLDVSSPEGFARAIEEGTEPSFAATVAMDQLVSQRQIRVLLYNTQTISAVTASVRKLAAAAHIPVVGVSETLPPSYHDFQDWQLAQARSLLQALEHR